MLNPIPIKYHYYFEKVPRYGYLVGNNETHAFVLSVLTVKIIKEINEKLDFNRIYIPKIGKEVIEYEQLDGGFSEQAYSPFIKGNLRAIIELSRENYVFVSYICEFLDEFYDYPCKIDFGKTCQDAYYNSKEMLTVNLLSKLYALVFSYFQEIYEEQRLSLLMNPIVSNFVIDFEKNVD